MLAAAVLLGGLANTALADFRSVACDACAGRIPDSDGTNDGVLTGTITMPADACVGAAVLGFALQLDVAHTNVGDLKVTLKNPSNVSIVVLPRTAASAKCAADDISAVFSDTGSPVTCGDTIPAFTGELKSNGLMTTLGTTSTPGVWQFEIRDQAPGGYGFLNNAQLRVTCDRIFANGFEP